MGQHLVDGGFLTRQQLFDGLARQWEVARRDLDRHPPDPDVIGRVELELSLERGWVPCEVDADGHLVVATSVRPGPDLVEEVQDQFPSTRVRFVACTRRDLDHLAVRIRRERADHPSAAPRSGRLARCRSLVVRDLLSGLAAVAVLTVAVAAPATWLVAVLAVAGAVFLSAAIVQSWAALRSAMREGTSRPGEPSPAEGTPPGNVLLPTYSVLVPVRAAAQVAPALALLVRIDYPTSRLDAVLLVDDAAPDVLPAVQRAAPPSWVRVVAVASRLFADPAAVYDEGLALARGRYVVAFTPDETPARDQLCRAVTAFESDLEENLTIRRGRPPLAGLRVGRRVRGGRSLAAALDELDQTLVLDRVHPWGGPSVELRHDLTSVHFNTRVLRRLGGFRFADGPGPGAASVPARMARLDSETRDGRRPRPATLVAERAEAVAWAVRTAIGKVRQLDRQEVPGWPALADVLLGLLAPALLLSYPAALLAAAAFVVRRAELAPSSVQLGLVGLAALALGLLAAMSAALVLGPRRQGWRALGPALLLPGLWLVHGIAAWYAALVLLPCRPPDMSAAPASPLGERPG